MISSTAAPDIASVSWGDHLGFGEGDGRLATRDALARRLDAWRDELGCGAIHWRLLRTHLPGVFEAAPGYEHSSETAARGIDWDDLQEVPGYAHAVGLRAFLYVSLFDEGWPLAPAAERQRSYHNAMHCQHVAWQTRFTREHPEMLAEGASGEQQAGVCCLAYAAVRTEFVQRFTGLLDRGDWDGLFVCLRSQSRPAEHGDQYGFSAPVRADFERSRGRPLSPPGAGRRARAVLGGAAGMSNADVGAWRDLLGSYLTLLLRELRGVLDARGRQLSVGAARGDVLGPPLGNATLQWRQWIKDALVDELVINQDSSRCPSMWHELWPMHRGDGYVQSYLDGSGMPSLPEQLRSQYAPAFAERAARLYVARQWEERSGVIEAELRATPPVAGLVFSAFRHDNPGAIARGDWRA